MRINTSNCTSKKRGKEILDLLKQGHRFFGQAGAGLEITLAEKEKELSNLKHEKEQKGFYRKDADLIAEVAKLKAGIEGERSFNNIMKIKYKDSPLYNNGVLFSSISFGDNNPELDYIPDTDFIFVVGRKILGIDVKNLKLNSKKEYYYRHVSQCSYALFERALKEDKDDKEVIEVHSSRKYLNKFLEEARVSDKYEIREYTVLVNDLPPQETVQNFSDENMFMWVGDFIDELDSICRQEKDNDIDLELLCVVSNRLITKEIVPEIKTISEKYRQKFKGV